MWPVVAVVSIALASASPRRAGAGGGTARAQSRVLAHMSTTRSFTDVLPPNEPAGRLSAEQRARTLGASTERGVISTLADGAPFSAPVDFVLNEQGEPVFILKEGSPTHANIVANSAASLLLLDEASAQSLTLIGSVGPLPEQEFAQSHVDFLNVHPIARECIAAGGLSFFKLAVSRCFLQGVSEETTGDWLPTEAYGEATIDALAPFAPSILESMNGAKRADLGRFLSAYYGEELSDCRLVAIDELGFDITVRPAAPADGKPGKRDEERRRIGFTTPQKTEQEARSLFVKTFFQAWDPPPAKATSEAEAASSA